MGRLCVAMSWSVRVLVFSGDSRQLAVGNGDEIVRYDLEMGREIAPLARTGPVNALAFIRTMATRRRLRV